jgi:hypothetical protein
MDFQIDATASNNKIRAINASMKVPLPQGADPMRLRKDTVGNILQRRDVP